ncbi:MAG: acyloxyacyl hydrolase [Bacteroidales bacterium]|nr:acyloxyacyl hydrolase [Bacteroidales bacterium]
MNFKRLLLCLAVLLLHQASYAQQKSSVVHRAGVSVRPAWNQQLWDFYRGDNPSGQPVRTNSSVHLQYSFMFPEGTILGDMYPSAYQGIGLAPYSFFNYESIGFPVALYVFQGGSLLRFGNRLSLDYEWNFGASFGWKTNSVTGTSVNAFIDAGLMLTWRPVRQWSFSAGADVFHFSNGSVKQPNAGLNCLGTRISATRVFGADRIPENRRPFLRNWEQRSFVGNLDLDVVLFGAPKQVCMGDGNNTYVFQGTYAVAGFSLNPMYQASRLVRLGVSYDFQYDGAANLWDYIYRVEDGVAYASDPPRGTQVSAGLSLRTEFVMPVFSINIGAGYKVMTGSEDQKGAYMLIALKTWLTDNLFLHTGYMFRGLYSPEHLMLGLGWSFGR